VDPVPAVRGRSALRASPTIGARHRRGFPFPSRIRSPQATHHESYYLLAACVGLSTLALAQTKSDEGASLLSRTANAKGDVHSVTATPLTQMAGGTTIDIDVSDTQSWDGLDDSSNTILTVPIPAGKVVTGVGWDVNLTTVGASWLSEAVFYFDGMDQDGTGLFLTPGAADGFPGSGSYFSPVIDLTDNGIPDIPILGDGLLYIQLFESFDDVADAVDADWTMPSTLTVVYDDPPAPRCPLYIEDFEGGTPPAGWSVLDNAGTGAVWDTAAFFGQSNNTPGSGECATIDSNFFGSGIVVDTDLISAPIDVPDFPTQLEYDFDYNDFSASTDDIATVDISDDGGATYTNLATYTDVDSNGSEVFDLSAFAGQTVQLRFHYESGWDFWFQVDNVAIYATATATSRNSGTNPASYTANAPVQGETFEATVDLTTTGHSMAGLVGFRTPLDLTLPGGQTLLVNVADPESELLGLGLVSGPMAAFSLDVPTDCAIASLDLSTQAIHIGGVMPFALSNAVDLRVGD